MKSGMDASKDKFRKGLSDNGDSWLRDGEFDTWWQKHGSKFPSVGEDSARCIWTAAYDDGYEWGKEVMRDYE